MFLVCFFGSLSFPKNYVKKNYLNNLFLLQIRTYAKRVVRPTHRVPYTPEATIMLNPGSNSVLKTCIVKSGDVQLIYDKKYL